MYKRVGCFKKHGTLKYKYEITNVLYSTTELASNNIFWTERLVLTVILFLQSSMNLSDTLKVSLSLAHGYPSKTMSGVVY